MLEETKNYTPYYANGVYLWACSDVKEYQHEVPSYLWKLLTCGAGVPGSRTRVYESDVVAMRDLNNAIVRERESRPDGRYYAQERFGEFHIYSPAGRRCATSGDRNSAELIVKALNLHAESEKGAEDR